MQRDKNVDSEENGKYREKNVGVSTVLMEERKSKK